LTWCIFWGILRTRASGQMQSKSRSSIHAFEKGQDEGLAHGLLFDLTNGGKLFFLKNLHWHFKNHTSSLTTTLRLRWYF
jgi:hypothetical protein